MTTDRYTRTVLTVIAIALSVIAVRMNFSDTAGAAGKGCGDSSSNPCYFTSNDPLSVKVENWPEYGEQLIEAQ